MPHCWKLLGLDQTDDQRAIKLAYAEKIKTVHPEEDPEGFKALQEAYRDALSQARNSSLRTEANGQSSLYDQGQLFSGLTSLSTEDVLAQEEWPQTEMDFSLFGQQGLPVAETEDSSTGEGAFEMAEQLATLEEVDELLEEVRTKFGLINRFETCLELLESYGPFSEATTIYFWNGLSDHVQNMYLFGTWQAREELSAMFLSHGCQQVSQYIMAVGLLGIEGSQDRDTVLEVWRGK